MAERKRSTAMPKSNASKRTSARRNYNKKKARARGQQSADKRETARAKSARAAYNRKMQNAEAQEASSKRTQATQQKARNAVAQIRQDMRNQQKMKNMKVYLPVDRYGEQY